MHDDTPHVYTQIAAACIIPLNHVDVHVGEFTEVLSGYEPVIVLLVAPYSSSIAAVIAVRAG